LLIFIYIWNFNSYILIVERLYLLLMLIYIILIL